MHHDNSNSLYFAYFGYTKRKMILSVIFYDVPFYYVRVLSGVRN